MNVVFDNIVFSLQKSGGVSVVWQELISRYMAGNSNVAFLEHPTDISNVFRMKLDLSKEKSLMYSSLFLNIRRYLTPRLKIIKKPFIFHSSYFRTCSNPNAINITTVHDFTYEYYLSGLGKKLHCWQKYNSILNSDAIVCISENTKKDLLKFIRNVDENRIHVIYNGVSDEYCVIDRNAEQNLPFRSKSYVLFVGSRVKYKNFELAVQGVAQTDLNLIIVGPKLNGKERRFVDDLLPKQRYIDMGYLANEKLNVFYNHALALLYPSSYEGFGIPVLEAQRAGCPVIALKSSSIPEVIGDTPLLMKEPKVEEIISKLYLLSDERLMKIVVSEGITNSKRFSWERMYNNYIRLYEDMWEKCTFKS